MTPERFGAKPGQHIPGAVVHEYLRQFCEEFDLTSRLRLQTKVGSAELQDSGAWVLTLCSVDGQEHQTWRLVAKRLVIATGLTSEPHIPKYRGLETFKGNFLHSRQLKDRAEDIRTSKDVIVVGANKSAWDTCYSAAMAGAHVSMVIRPGGGGPSWVWPVKLPFKLSLQQIATTRIFTLFEPCMWTENNDGFTWARRLLHQTWLGRQLVKAFWKLFATPVFSANKYASHPELAKLKPWISTFWMGNSLGVHNYETNWFDLVKQGKITVHVADVTSLSGNKVFLSSGEVIHADTFVSCTGWKIAPPIKFLPEDVVGRLGLPGTKQTKDERLVSKARKEVFKTAPELRWGPDKKLPQGSAPVVSVKDSGASQPYRLYRFMVPSAEGFLRRRNIAFTGAHLALNATTVAQAQALWITAFFKHEIPHLKSPEFNVQSVQYQTILQSEYCRLRHPPTGGGSGERCPDLIFDGLLYTDVLLSDVGIKTFRKHGLWQELFQRYLPKDYAGMTEELIERANNGK